MLLLVFAPKRYSSWPFVLTKSGANAKGLEYLSILATTESGAATIPAGRHVLECKACDLFLRMPSHLMHELEYQKREIFHRVSGREERYSQVSVVSLPWQFDHTNVVSLNSRVDETPRRDLGK